MGQAPEGRRAIFVGNDHGVKIDSGRKNELVFLEDRPATDMHTWPNFLKMGQVPEGGRAIFIGNDHGIKIDSGRKMSFFFGGHCRPLSLGSQICF
jgi:hypothetical protein